jgi:serine/threonine protein kinase
VVFFVFHTRVLSTLAFGLLRLPRTLFILAFSMVNDLRSLPFDVFNSYFMAPEVFEEKYGSKADIWSVGGCIYQMLTGSPPWKSMGFKSPIALFIHLKSHDRPPKLPELNGCNDLEYSLLEKILTVCFQRDPSKRPSASAILSHTFLKSNIAHNPKSPNMIMIHAMEGPSPSQSPRRAHLGENSESVLKSPLNQIPENEELSKSLSDSLCYSLSLQSPLPKVQTRTVLDTSSWPDWAKGCNKENTGCAADTNTQKGINPYAKKTPFSKKDLNMMWQKK